MSPPRLSVMDLMVAMAPCVDEVTMSQTFELIRPYLEVRTRDILTAQRCGDVFQTSHIILNAKHVTFSVIYCLDYQELNNRFISPHNSYMFPFLIFGCVE